MLRTGLEIVGAGVAGAVVGCFISHVASVKTDTEVGFTRDSAITAIVIAIFGALVRTPFFSANHAKALCRRIAICASVYSGFCVIFTITDYFFKDCSDK